MLGCGRQYEHKTIMTKCSAIDGNVTECAKTGVRICGQTKGEIQRNVDEMLGCSGR